MTKRTRKFIVFIPILIALAILGVLGLWPVYILTTLVLTTLYMGLTIAYWISSGIWDIKFAWRMLSE